MKYCQLHLQQTSRIWLFPVLSLGSKLPPYPTSSMATASWLHLPMVLVLPLLPHSSSPHPLFSPQQAKLFLERPKNEHATFLLQTFRSLCLPLGQLSPDQVSKTLHDPFLKLHLLFTPLLTLHPPQWLLAVPWILQACPGLSVFIIAFPTPWTTFPSERSMVFPYLLQDSASMSPSLIFL